MGAFVPSPGPDRPGSCDGEAGCVGTCLGPADSSWPVLVVLGCLLPTLTDLSPSSSLTQVLAPLLARLSPASWQCLQAENLGNPRRPVWLTALVRILQPFLAPAVSDLLQAVEDGKTWTKSHISPAKTVLWDNLAELLDSLPLSLADCLLHISAVLPASLRPLANSVVAQVVVTTVYQTIHSLLPLLRNHRVQKEKIDFLVGLSESLCTEDHQLELAGLEARLEARLDPLQQTGQESPPTPSLETCDLIAHNILQTQENRLAFTALHR